MAFNMSEALVCRIQTQDLPDPKYTRVQLGIVAGGYRVVVGKEHQPGELGLFIPADTQLDEAFCLANNLLRKHPTSGEKLPGYLEENRRVRAISLCGVRSEGIWLPFPDCFKYLAGVSNLILPVEEGQTITNMALVRGIWRPGNVGDEVIVLAQKYFTPATIAARGAKKHSGGARRETKYFPMHYDTAQWKRVGDEVLPEGALVVVTEKLHGSSQRVAFALHDVAAPETFLGRLWRRLRGKTAPSRPEWRYLCGTRRVITGVTSAPGKFATDQPWRDRWSNHIAHHLRKGETAFFEIVGYQHGSPDHKVFHPEFFTPQNQPRWVGETTLEIPTLGLCRVEGTCINPPIMPPQKTAKLPEVAAQYGQEVAYTYGCENGQSQAYLYRVTMTNEDGHVVELPWHQVEKRAAEMGILAPPVYERFAFRADPSDFENLRGLVRDWEEGPSNVDERHPREGICIRIESSTRGTEVYKNKSWAFGVLEGYLKDRPDYVDTEEAA